MTRLKFVGLDVHAETIAVAVAEQGGEVRALGIIPNREESIRKLVRKLGPVEQLRFCYEAGPTGYALYWQLTRMGAKCEVVAPTLVPVKAGDRVKTDRRDALKLARNYRAGELTPVWVPDAAHEALRDLVRAREAAKKDELRARHRLNKFLLRHGRLPPMGVKSWTMKYLEWIKREVHFEQMAQEATLLDYLHEVEHADARIMRLDGAIEEAVKCVPPKMRAVIEALQALRGIARVASVTIVAELGELSRFARAKQLMGYGGIVSSEHSSGECTRRGGITKTGNAHLRRVVVEAAWTYRHRPAVGTSLRKRQEKVSEEVKSVNAGLVHSIAAALKARFVVLGTTKRTDDDVVQLSTRLFDVADKYGSGYNAAVNLLAPKSSVDLSPSEPITSLPPITSAANGESIYRSGVDGVSNPKCTYTPNPQSEEATKFQLSGTMLVDAVINSEGKPENVRIVHGLPNALNDRTIATLKTWRCNPALKDSKPVPTRVQFEVHFEFRPN